MTPKYKVGEVRRWQVPNSSLHGKGKILRVFEGPWGWEYLFEDGWVAEKFVVD
jgi:hypothetical protein